MESTDNAQEAGQRSTSSWRRIDLTDEEFPGRQHDNGDLDDYDELIRVSQRHRQ